MRASWERGIVRGFLPFINLRLSLAFTDPTEKLSAFDSVIPPSLSRGQFTVLDRLIAMLHG